MLKHVKTAPGDSEAAWFDGGGCFGTHLGQAERVLASIPSLLTILAIQVRNHPGCFSR